MVPKDYIWMNKKLDNIEVELSERYQKWMLERHRGSMKEFRKIEKLDVRDPKDRKKLMEIWKEDVAYIHKVIAREYVVLTKPLLEDIYERVSSEFDTLPRENPKLIQRVLNHQFMGMTFSDRIWLNKDLLLDSLDTVFKDYFNKGKSFSEITKQMSGILQASEYNVNRVVRTEGMRMLNNTKLETYKEADVERVEWYAAEDERMCKICGNLHEKKFKVDEVPSAHPNCRCTIIPVIE